MTAEIVIMNKSVIALSADSAVTIGHEGKKIYNTVNKLFALSKYHPVGIMIYDSASIMDIPWETVIKEFRKYLGDDKFDTLIEYYDKFVGFIEDENIIFDSSNQERYYYNYLSVYFYILQEEIDNKVKETIKCSSCISDEQIKKIIDDVIKDNFDKIEKFDLLPDYDELYVKNIISKYKTIIDKSKDDIFDKRPINKSNHKKLDTIAGYLSAKNSFALGRTGIVIAGFGDKEIFPSVIDFRAEFVLNNKLKLYNFNHRKIGHDSNAQIIPFAQHEMPARFMEGIDPFYSEVIKSYIDKMLGEYKDILVDKFSKLTTKGKSKLKNEMESINSTIIFDIMEQLKKYRHTNYVSPVLQAVAVLPKDELAAMAESLVHLTSLKRKFSMEQETVAGPIDVAIISKGDGLVWIKRKHYFNQELNQHFLENYYK